MPPTTTLNEPKTAATVDPGGGLSPTLLADLERGLLDHPTARLAQNAVTKTPATDVALDRSVVTGLAHSFSHRLDEWEVTNQKKSGRCWMFAALNLFRVGAMKKMNLEKFEFSQNYTLFWDKLERANYFLEAIIATADRDVDDRTVAFLLDRPLEDGGQWNMFINVVKKHGVVPQAVMPETESSSNTRTMNGLVIQKLREAPGNCGSSALHGAPMEAARAAKQEILQVVHRMLSIHLGTPPPRFDWQWNDKDKVFHRDGEMTPHQFADKYIDLPMDEYVCLVHDPRPSSPYGRTFTVEFLGNVVGGDMVKYVNVEIDLIKQIAANVIAEGEPVWFGCDVGKMMQRDMGLWDRSLFDFARLYDTEFDLDKPGRLEYHQTLMTHAMLFTGVDIVGGRPRRWRVENSWGDENGEKGFFAMNDSWFDEYVFEIAARRDRLPADLQAAIDTPPIVLPAWDPMGALA